MNYYALSQYYRPLPELDEWIRRRVRMCYMKQWRRTRTRIRHLLNLGASKTQAIPVGMSSKGHWRACADVCHSTWHEQRLAQRTRFSFSPRPLDCVSLSEWLVQPVMNRPVRTRTLGGVGRAGETPALTRLGTQTYRNAPNLTRSPRYRLQESFI
jgi:hypothetical protein